MPPAFWATPSGHYLEIARQNAEFVRPELRLPDGTLRHIFRDGGARVEGLMEDHALYASGTGGAVSGGR